MNLKFGKITEVDAAKGLAKVTFEENDDLLSDWLPMSQPQTLKNKFIIPYDINEHVWCIMDELCENGVIGGAIYDAGNIPPTGTVNDDISVTLVPNLCIKYKRSTSTLSIIGDGNLTININGNVNVNATTAKIETTGIAEIKAAALIKLTAATVQCSGILSAASIQIAGGTGAGVAIDAGGNITTAGVITGGTMKEGLIQLGTHKHIGVTTGSGTSGTPTP